MVFKESDANRQGLKTGDLITKLDSTPVTTAAQYNDYMKAHAGQEVQVFYLDKNKQEQFVNVKANLTDDANATNRSPRVSTVPDGLTIEVPTKHLSFTPIEMVGDAWSQTTNAITLIPRTFGALFNGSVSINSLAGPVGMAQITDTVATNAGFLGLLTLMALLSVNLGIVNILPLPALDGGRLVFVIIEFITRGRRIPPEKEGLVHFAGMVLLLSLMVFIAWNDIVRLVTGGSF
jgi:regulator of sigma E protease